MKILFRIVWLPVMLLGAAVELMIISIAWVVRFLEEHIDDGGEL